MLYSLQLCENRGMDFQNVCHNIVCACVCICVSAVFVVISLSVSFSIVCCFPGSTSLSFSPSSHSHCLLSLCKSVFLMQSFSMEINAKIQSHRDCPTDLSACSGIVCLSMIDCMIMHCSQADFSKHITYIYFLAGLRLLMST